MMVEQRLLQVPKWTRYWVLLTKVSPWDLQYPERRLSLVPTWVLDSRKVVQGLPGADGSRAKTTIGWVVVFDSRKVIRGCADRSVVVEQRLCSAL